MNPRRIWPYCVLIITFACAAAAQTVPKPLVVTHVYNITSSTQVQDNRSAVQSCNIFTYDVQRGVGAWSVQLEYADVSAKGPWTSFGSAAIVTSTTQPAVGIGSGYHNWVRLNTTAGSTVVNLSCEKDFFLPVVSSGSGPFDCPLASPTTTGCLTGPDFVEFLSKQEPNYTPAQAGGVPVPLSQIFQDGCDGINARGFGVNPQNSDNLAGLNQAFAAANSTGSGIVCLPGGTYQVSNTIDVPDKVQLRGRGRGDAGGTNTTIQAGQGFPVNTPLVTFGAVSGPTNIPHFGTRISNMTLDCAGVPGCIDMQDNYGEEQSGGDHLAFVNAAVCLQVNGSDRPSTGLVQNEYGWHDWECFPFQSALLGVVPVQANNVENGFGFSRGSIVHKPGYAFNYGMVVSGNFYHVESIHIEGSLVAGIIVGPENTPYNTIGGADISINDVTIASSSGVAVEIAANQSNYPSGLSITRTLQDLSGDVPFACGNIRNDYTGECVNSPNYNLGNQHNGSSTIFDLGYGNTWTLFNQIKQFGTTDILSQGTDPSVVIRNGTSFKGNPITTFQNGDMDFGNASQSGGKDYLFRNAGNKICQDSSGNNNCGGINIQGVFTPDFTDAILFNNYYDTATGKFNLLGDGTQFVGGIVTLNPGGPLGLSPGGAGIGFVSDAFVTTPAMETPGQWSNHIKTIIPGWGGIQFIRSTQPGCSDNQRGLLYFNRDNGNTTDVTNICAYSSGVIGWQSLGSGGGGGVNATSIQGVPVTAGAPTLNYVLQFNGTNWTPAVVTASTINGTAVPAGAACVGTNGSSQFISASCGGSSVTLQTGGVNNTSQATLNLSGTGSATVTNTSAGNVVINAPAAPIFQTGGINNASQGTLNVVGAGTVSAVNSGGTVTLTGTGSGSPSGASGGVLAGVTSGVNSTYPNPKFRDWAIATDYASVQTACTDVGITGVVVIPWNYAGTDKTWNCGGTQIIDQRISNYTRWNVKQFGLTGDGATITDGRITGGAAVLTSAGQHCFVTADNGKHVKVSQGNSTGAVSVLASNDISASIVSTSGCAATISVTSTGTGSLTGLKVYYGTDDSTAFRNLLSLANAKPLSAGQIYFPAGIYTLSGTFYITTSMGMQGDGINSTSLRQIDPTADLLIWKYGNTGVTPNAFPVPGSIRDINLQGEGMGTSGNLLVLAISSFLVENVALSGTNGVGIMDLGERNHFDHIRARNVRRAFETSLNFPGNESYLRHFDFMDTGCIVDSLLSTGTFYNNNINSVNGIYPGMTAAGVSDGSPGPYNITQDPATAIILDGVTDFEVADGSIKTTRCAGGATVTESNGQTILSNLYTENGTISGYVSPDYVVGGQHPHSVTTGSLSNVATAVDIQDGRSFDNCVGLAADTGLTISGGVSGTSAFLYPPDFSFGSSSPSSIGGGILQGTFETLTSGGCVHDTTGSGWHAGFTRQAGAIAWPAGAVFEQQPVLPGNVVMLANNHIHSDSFDTAPRYNVSCLNPDLGTICGSVIVGITSDLLHRKNTSLGLNSSRGVKFSGDISESGQFANQIGGTIQAHTNAYVDTRSVQAIFAAPTNPIVTDNNMTLSVPEIQAIIRRVAYPSGNPPNMTYAGPNGQIAMLGASNAAQMPTGYTTIGISPIQGAALGTRTMYGNGYEFADQVAIGTQTPNNVWRFEGDSVGNPGVVMNVLNGPAANYTSVFNITAATQSTIAAGNPVGANLALNFGNSKAIAGAAFNNAVEAISIKNVVAPTVAATGGLAGNYTYTVTACATDGTCTAGVNVTSIANGPTTLSGSAFNTITWNAPTGNPAYYNVYRTLGGPSTGQINTVPILATASRSLVDTGQAGVGSTPATNNTGSFLSSSSTGQRALGHFEVDGDVSNVLIRGDGTLSLIPVLAQPACNVAERGSFWYNQAVPGTADSVQTCSKNASDAYVWTTVGTGSGGGTPAGATNAVQFNSAGVFGGATVNATATQQFLSQTSSGVPLFSALTLANLPTAIPLNNFATLANNTVIGNNSGATAIPAALSVAGLNSMLGTSPATTSTFGVVKVDGTSITSAAGVLSAASSAPAFSAILPGTNTAALTMGTAGVLTTSGTGIINANQVNGAIVPLGAACAGTNGSGQIITVSCAGGGGGSVNTGSINGGGTIAAVAGNLNFQIPVPVAGSGIGIVNAGSGNSQTATFGVTAPFNPQVSNGGGYTAQTTDCVADIGTILITGTTTMQVGVPQAGLSGNFLAGCKMQIINNSTGAVTVSFTTSTWNTISGLNAVVLGARVSGTAHSVLITSDGSNYYGSQQ